MKHSPAFQFYVNDWLSSANITLMTPAEEGAYIRLLCYCWADPDCSLPDDDDILAAYSRLGEGWLKGGSAKIRKCFRPHPSKPGRIVNDRLLAEREKQRVWRQKSVEGGLKSAASRHNKSKGGSTTVPTKRQPASLANGSNQRSTLQSSVFSLTTTTKDTSFEAWWLCYPVKKKKKAAFKSYCRALKETTAEVLMDALKRQIPIWRADRNYPKYVPHPTTWLNDGQWDDGTDDCAGDMPHYTPTPEAAIAMISGPDEELEDGDHPEDLFGSAEEEHETFIDTEDAGT